jgi:hypothetical protein
VSTSCGLESYAEQVGYLSFIVNAFTILNVVSVRGAYNHIMEVPKLDAAENRRQRAWVEKTTVSMVSDARKASSAVRSNVIEIERTWRSEDLKIRRDSNEQNMPVQVLLYISCSAC